MKNKISFDFDSTLSDINVLLFASKLLSKGFEVWVVTSRFDNKTAQKKFGIKNKNADLFLQTDSIGIKRKNIVFTNMKDKAEFFKKK